MKILLGHKVNQPLNGNEFNRQDFISRTNLLISRMIIENMSLEGIHGSLVNK